MACSDQRQYGSPFQESSIGLLLLAILPRYAIIPLIQLFIDNIPVLHPIVIGLSIFKFLEMMHQSQDAHMNAMDHWIFWLVMAISLMSFSRIYGDTVSRHAIEHAGVALEYGEEVCRPGSI